MLNEFITHHELDFTITSGAFTKARKKLKHTAFIELNQGLIDIYYKDANIKRLYDFRIIAFDGSDIILPNNEEIKQEFGSIRSANGHHKEIGDYARATLEIGYDVLNNIAVSCCLGHSKAQETVLAMDMLNTLDKHDLLIYDRAYASYLFLAQLLNKQKNFIVRCPRMFKEVTIMFDDDAPSSKIVTLRVTRQQWKKVKAFGLDKTITVRLVKVILSTGEAEVLATSLFDTEKYPADLFKELYHLRWGVETFYSKIKGRLCLENFTGKSVESVRQDTWATVMISNLETIMTEDIEEEVNAQCINNETSEKKVNKAVSFNAIKNAVFDLISSNKNSAEIINSLRRLFKMNMLIVRPDRKVDRKPITVTRSRNYHRRTKKQVF